jgi:hypothetical protein
MGALSSLFLRSNLLLNRESGEALAGALEGNLILTELDISNNYEQYIESSQDGPGFAQALAVGLIDNGALSKLIFGGDEYTGDWTGFGYEVITPEPATLEVGMTEAEFSNKHLGEGSAIIISAWLTHKDNGAMTSLNLAANEFGVEGAKIIAACLPKCT